jgi:hypothetical protein
MKLVQGSILTMGDKVLVFGNFGLWKISIFRIFFVRKKLETKEKV